MHCAACTATCRVFPIQSHTIIIAILSVGFLWQAHTLGDFPMHIAGEGNIWVNRLKLHTPTACNTEHAQFVDVSEVDNGWHTVVRC